MVVEQVMTFVMVWIASFVIHELGHALTLAHLTKTKVGFRYEKGDVIVGEKWQYKMLSPSKYILVLGNGIVAGLLPFFLLSGSTQIVSVIIYIMFPCRSDFINLWKYGVRGEVYE